MLLHPLQPRNLPALVRLLNESKVSFAGTLSPALCRCVLRDALSGGPVSVITATEGPRLAGYAISITHPAAYWRRFAMRHPLLAARIAATRLFPARHAPALHAPIPSSPLPHLAPEPGPESWSDSTPAIAKIVIIGVHPDFQGQGLARALYPRLFEELTRRGITRVDACVALDNHASLRLHHRTGWKMSHAGTYIFCTRIL